VRVTKSAPKISTANKDAQISTSDAPIDKDVVRIGQLPQTTPDLSRQAATIQKKKSLFKQSRASNEDDDVAQRMRGEWNNSCGTLTSVL
jgi:hypothetical protein